MATEEKILVSLAGMAQRLRVTSRWLRAQAEAGSIPCVRVEKRLLFSPQAVERALAKAAGADVEANANGR